MYVLKENIILSLRETFVEVICSLKSTKFYQYQKIKNTNF